MKQKVEYLPQDDIEKTREGQAAFERPAFQKHGRNAGKWIKYIPIPVTLICFILAVILLIDMFAVGTAAAGESFVQAEGETEKEIYQLFYDGAYDRAEQAHHVSNRAAISIDRLREIQQLEVLPVSEVSYQVEAAEETEGIQATIAGLFNQDNTSWLEVPGNGVFTVDLQAGEFIIDAERQLVLLRIPSPELSNFTLDYENVEVLYFDEGGVFKNSAKYGVDKAVEQLQNAELDMVQRISNNQELYKRARDIAQDMLTRLVKQLNPQLPDLTVEVEFLD